MPMEISYEFFDFFVETMKCEDTFLGGHFFQWLKINAANPLPFQNTAQ